MIWALWLLGCPRPVPPEGQSGWQMATPVAEETPALAVESGVWRGDGVSVWVAPGWSGTHRTGPPETLELEDGETGTRLVVELGPAALDLPRGCELLFEDTGTWRSVPLTDIRTASCVDESGALHRYWVGQADYVSVRLAAHYPMSGVVEAQHRLEEILSTVTASAGG